MIFRGVDGNQTLNRAKLCLSKHSTSQPSRAERQLTTFFLITSVILRTVLPPYTLLLRALRLFCFKDEHPGHFGPHGTRVSSREGFD
jgi:hypothetical protein